jgi:O-antigen/teichoic acid export membrane protein
MASYQTLIVLMLGRGLQVLAGFVTIKITTTLLSPAQLGSMNQMMSLAMLGTAALLVPVSAYMGRGCLEWRDAGVLSSRLFSYFLLVIAVGLSLGLVAWTVQSQTLLVSGLTATWVGGLVTLYTIGYSLHSMGTTGLNLIGYRVLYVFFGNVAVWVGLLLAVLCSRNEITPETWLLGIFSGFLLSSLSYPLLAQYGRKTAAVHSIDDRDVLPFDRWTVFMFVWPQTVVFTLWWIQSQSYRFILMWVTDIANVGLFAAGYMICSVPMQTFETLFNEFYGPTLFRALKGQDLEGFARAWNAYAGAYIPAVILFGAFLIGNAAFMVKLLLGEQFQAVAPILIWPALTETIRAISSTLHQLGLVKVDMTATILPVVVGALVAPTLVYFMAPHAPLLGTALALLAAGVAVFAVVIPISYCALPVVWPVRRIMYAAALGVPLCLMGGIMGFGEISQSEALIALVISSLVMGLLQYAMAKEWLHEMRPAVQSGL